MKKGYFLFKTLDDLRREVARLNLDITFEERLEAVKRPVQIGNRRIGNSLGIHPMEGCDGTLEGKPGELTFRRWRRFAEGGAKLIWGEATAVAPEGLANPRQLLMSEENLAEWERLLQSTRTAHRERFGRDDDLMIGIQLTHSGRYSYRKPLIVYHHPQVDPLTYADKIRGAIISKEYPPVSDDYLEKLEDACVAAAIRAAKVGFDFIDIKQCHSYLLNELLGARERNGRYGGSFENRTRFIRNVLRKIHDEVKENVILASRVSAFDGIPFQKDTDTGKGRPAPFTTPYRYGFGVNEENPTQEDLSEPLQLIRLMTGLGVKIVSVSMGSPYYNPHIVRPYERPPVDDYYAPEHPLIGVARHFRITGEIQRAFPELIVLGAGYSWLQKFFVNAGESNLRNGRVSILAVGRGAIAHPEYAVEALSLGELATPHVCIAVSFCTNLMRSKHNEMGQYPVGCVPRDRVYAAIYRESLGKKEHHPGT
jgi:2,4-dienoyl-CoA reductase-like NADH-dependent reductase (Old Yellow Enzyme family)